MHEVDQVFEAVARDHGFWSEELVRVLAEGAPASTRGLIAGTPSYMAPEQAAGTRPLTTAADIYSLGATLYALLTGRPPFEGGSLTEAIQKIRSEPPVRPKKYQLAIPDLFEDAVMKMLAKEPQDRFQTPTELLDQLERIAKFKDQLKGEIYGIEPGNDGNRLILDMIGKDAFGLKDFKLVESSEQGMLAQVARAVKDEAPIVFLGWEPHPMNANFEMAYLSGGDDYFGPNFGGATVYTNIRAGYASECPNVGKLLNNLSFTLQMENEIMGKILDGGMAGEDAAEEWLKANPATLDAWLAGVTTIDGEDGLAAVKSELGL